MNYIVSQFANPKGLIGQLIGHIIAIKGRERMLWGVSKLNIQPEDSILEIGFGPGTAIERLAAIAIKGRIHGIEVSDVMVKQATKRLASYISRGQVKIESGTVSSLAFNDNSFDIVFTINSFLYWPDQFKDLQEVKRVLKPGGRAVIIQQPRSMKTGIGLEEKGEDISGKLVKAGFCDIVIDSKHMKPVTCLSVTGIKPVT